MRTEVKKMLAIDMGATSIRGVLAWAQGDHLVTEEVLRFSHKPVRTDKGLFWDLDGILGRIEETVLKYGAEIGSIGVDGWGVDFGILDDKGNLLEAPHAYRDPANATAHTAFRKRMTDEAVFYQTGIQVMEINTLYQLYRIRCCEENTFGRIRHILLLSDLICYFLTGEMHTDLAMLSTTQLYHTGRLEYSKEILNILGLPESVFPPLVPYGVVRGSTANAKIESLRRWKIPVCSVAGHDTASAVLVTAAMTDPDTLFLSCGTWSLLGAVREKATLTSEVQQADFTNELTVGNRSLLLQNITGLYVLEKYKGQMEERTGRKVSYAEISEGAGAWGRRNLVFDIGAPIFGQNEFDAREAIARALLSSGREIPDDFGFYEAIYQSLAEKYLAAVKKLTHITGTTYRRIQIIGGGVKSEVLCRLIADRLGIPVLAGPKEATALGNLALQMVATGQASGIPEAAAFVTSSEEQHIYEPQKGAST